MLPKVDIKIDITKLKEHPILPEVLQILEIIRPEWLPRDIRHTVCGFFIYNEYVFYMPCP